MNTMLRKRWWCDWYLSPSDEEYFRDDEIFFFRLIILIPFVGMLISWPWWNNQSLFPWWFGTSSAGILTLICVCLVICHERIRSSTNLVIFMITLSAFAFHIAVSAIEYIVAAEGVCKTMDTVENSWYLLCIWPYSLLISVLRDGLYFIIVIYLILSFQMPHRPSLNARLLHHQLLNPPPVLNHRRQRTRRPRRRRSYFVIRYILLRRGEIRRRRRRLLRN